MIEFSCDQCGKEFKAPDEAAGKSATCKQCGNRLRIPSQDDHGLAIDPDPMPPFTAAPVRPAVAGPASAEGERNRVAAALMAILLGSFGVHKFYLGQPL